MDCRQLSVAACSRPGFGPIDWATTQVLLPPMMLRSGLWKVVPSRQWQWQWQWQSPPGWP
ncbi:hypothetical protein CR918_11050 [Stenotrophomonas indicatrix]|nr:hypothetical protein CR918_11050 [Stenotrophomonas indicatrix]